MWFEPSWPTDTAQAQIYTGNVFIPSADGDCSTPGTVVPVSVARWRAVGTSYGDGSVTGAGRPRRSRAWQTIAGTGPGTVSPRARTTSSINGTIGRRPPQRQQVRVHEAFHAIVGGGSLCPTKFIRRAPQARRPRRRSGSRGNTTWPDSGAAERRSKRSAGEARRTRTTSGWRTYRKLGGHRIQPALWNRNVNACDWNTILPALASGSTYNMYFATASNAISSGHVYIDLHASSLTIRRLCARRTAFSARAVDKYGEQPEPALSAKRSPLHLWQRCGDSEHRSGRSGALCAPVRSSRRHSRHVQRQP